MGILMNYNKITLPKIADVLTAFNHFKSKTFKNNSLKFDREWKTHPLVFNLKHYDLKNIIVQEIVLNDIKG